MDEIKFDVSRPHETVHGHSFNNYRFIQDGFYFNATGIRVNPETGNVWGERDDELVADIENMEEAGMKGAAILAKNGLKLPTRLINAAKEAREQLEEKPAPRSAKVKKEPK